VTSPQVGVDVLPDFTVKPQRRGLLRRTVPTLVPAAAPVISAQPGPLQRERLAGELVTATDLIVAITEALAARQPMAVVQVGLDGLRGLNAAFGPEVGDVAVSRVGVVLAWALAPHPVARLSSDCFGILLPHDDQLEHLVSRALSLIAAADLSNDAAGVRTTASAGITLLDRTALTARMALHEADLAMAAAKAQGRNRLAVHDPSHNTAATELWENQLRLALEEDTLVLHAQPVQGVHAEVQQWELLVRLPASGDHLLPPAHFLPLAERLGLGREIDATVTRHAIELVQQWASRGQRITLEVNLTASTISDMGFVAQLEADLERAAIPASCLVFEVNAAIADKELYDVQVFAHRVRALGCKFALDGFGQGTAARVQLSSLPLDFVKLDGSLVRDLATNVVDQHLVSSLTRLAHERGCRVVAMNVAEGETRNLLVSYGVDYLQGFEIGRPMPLSD
jgi:diguanylate cyclase (GGDEF)-like protein